MEVIKDWRGGMPNTGWKWVFCCIYWPLAVMTTHYRFTDEGMVYTHGILHRQNEYMDYSRMHAINTKNDWLRGRQIQLEYGHDHMKTLLCIKNNAVVADELRHRAKTTRQKQGVNETDLM